MTDTDLVARAAAFARKAHEGQTRKYTGEPYINHPAEVASIIKVHRLPPHAVAAAWLHDVIEDCGVSADTLRAEFGDDVADLVVQVTDVSTPADGNRKKRKAKDLEHLRNACSLAQSIKLADIMSNTASIVERDPSFAPVYLQEKRELVAALVWGDTTLRARALRSLAQSD